MKLRIMSAVLATLLAIAGLVLATAGQARAPTPNELSMRGILAYIPLGRSLGCLNTAALRLLDRIEVEFGSVEIVSTCRPGALIAGTGRPSHHGTGNAIDFIAGDRKQAILTWLIANHKQGGTMTYADMDHIHVDIGRHFVSLASKSRTASSGSRGGTNRVNDRGAGQWLNDWNRMSLGGGR
jgi:hypothetical protein